MKRSDLIRDVAGLMGCGSVAFGSWLIYEPAGFIAGGLMLIAGALFTARAR